MFVLGIWVLQVKNMKSLCIDYAMSNKKEGQSYNLHDRKRADLSVGSEFGLKWRRWNECFGRWEQATEKAASWSEGHKPRLVVGQ